MTGEGITEPPGPERLVVAVPLVPGVSETRVIVSADATAGTAAINPIAAARPHTSHPIRQK